MALACEGCERQGKFTREGLGPHKSANQGIRRAEHPHVVFLYNTRNGLVRVGDSQASMLLVTATKDKLKHTLGTGSKSSAVRHDKRQEWQVLVFSPLDSLKLLNESTWPVLSRHAPWMRSADLDVNVLHTASVIVEHNKCQSACWR